MPRLIDYTVDEQAATTLNNTVSVDDVYPLLVVHEDADANTVDGVVFLPGGGTHYVTGYTEQTDTEAAPEPAAEPTPEPTPPPAEPVNFELPQTQAPQPVQGSENA